MEKRGFTALFAVVMILMLISFIPSLTEIGINYSDKVKDVVGVRTAEAANTEKPVTYLISTGYVGKYGYTDMPENNESRVLGVSTSRTFFDYKAKEVGRSYKVINNLKPGKAITFWVDFLNTGKSTWYNYGEHYVAVNVTDPAGRLSQFKHSFWKEYYRPARLLQKEVKPGEVGRFRFALLAPITAGVYKEKFNLVAENLTWIDGGYFEIQIGVGEKVTPLADYQAEEAGRSAGGNLKVDPGRAFTFWIDFKNTGYMTWYKDDTHFIALNVTNPVGRHSFFQHKFWKIYYRPCILMNERVYPGEIGRFRFAIQAPNQVGNYQENFGLVAENLTRIPGGGFQLNITVGQPYIPPPSQPVVNEPSIRVGLYNPDGETKIIASGQYDIKDKDGNLISTLESGEISAVTFSNKQYNLKIKDNQSKIYDSYLRFIPKTSDIIMEISNYNNATLWNASINDNKFRGIIEIRYSENTNKLWIINEIPLESYLRGLAEVSNDQPAEYLKALIIAARSYALWNYVHGGKHPTEYFDINSTTDQVYRGYNFEQRSVDPLKAVVETSGMVITHPDAVSNINPQGIALAPYSSGTDGRTRAWSEVWAGEYSWLISIEDPYGIISNALTLEGNHMVGLSGLGARGYAEKEGKTYDWILKHYYTGIEVQKIY